MADDSYRPPGAPVGDPESLRFTTPLGVAIAVGLLVSFLAMLAMSVAMFALTVDLSGVGSYSEISKRINSIPNLNVWIGAIRITAGAAGGWCAARLSGRWLAAALWIGGVLVAIPIGLSLALYGNAGAELALLGAYLFGSLPAARLASIRR